MLSLYEPSDIEHIIHKLHRKYHVSQQLIEVFLLAKLLTYPWLGKLRELDNLMQVVCIMSKGCHEINWGHIQDNLQQTLPQEQGANGLVTKPHDNELETMISANIIAVYARFQGNISQCVKYLGISRNTLYRKLKALGIKN